MDLQHALEPMGPLYRRGRLYMPDPLEARYELNQGEVTLAVDVRVGKVFRIDARRGYRGALDPGIQVGMKVREVLRLDPRYRYEECGALLMAEDVLGVSLGLEDSDPDPGEVPDLRVRVISVYAVEAFGAVGSLVPEDW
jgi:hypothetical protein